MMLRALGSWSLLLVLSLMACSGEGAGDDGSATGGRSSGGSSSGGQVSTGGASSTGGRPDGAGGGEAGSGGDSAGETPGGPPISETCTVFPGDNPWNLDVSALPVHPRSQAMIDSIGRSDTLHPDFGTEWEGAPIGIPFVLVDSSQAPVEVSYDAYGDESDPGPFPIPLDAPIEGGPDSDGDRHVIALDTEGCKLYELYRAFPQGNGWTAGSGVEYDLTRNEHHPEGCTSADAAGLPIFPGLVRYEEVVLQAEILHAVRFTVSRSRRAYVFPARHYASSDTDENLPGMGQRLRMKQDYDCSGFSSEVQVICTGMKRFGLILADNGSDWYVSGAPDPRWDDDALRDLRQVSGDAFEVVDTGDPEITDGPDCSL